MCLGRAPGVSRTSPTVGDAWELSHLYRRRTGPLGKDGGAQSGLQDSLPRGPLQAASKGKSSGKSFGTCRVPAGRPRRQGRGGHSLPAVAARAQRHVFCGSGGRTAVPGRRGEGRGEGRGAALSRPTGGEVTWRWPGAAQRVRARLGRGGTAAESGRAHGPREAAGGSARWAGHRGGRRVRATAQHAAPSPLARTHPETPVCAEYLACGRRLSARAPRKPGRRHRGDSVGQAPPRAPPQAPPRAREDRAHASAPRATAPRPARPGSHGRLVTGAWHPGASTQPAAVPTGPGPQHPFAAPTGAAL